MNPWLRHHRDALFTALARLKTSPLNAFLASLALGIVLALPATGEMLVLNFIRLAGLVSTKPQISLFMAQDAPAAAVADVDKRLHALRGVKELRFVPKADALARLKKSEGMAAVIESLPQNPLPDAFIILPASDQPESLEALKADLARMPKVAQVQLDSAWVKRLDAMLRLGRTALAILAGLLGVALVAVTFNTIRLQILTQRDEIEVSRLLGASDGFIRRPFYYSGLIQGLLGGAVAWLLVLGATEALREPLGAMAAAYSLSLTLSHLPAEETVLLFAVALLLGYVGTWLSVRRFLREA
ncbi:MAG: permease-like cell division protein FtsX [Rhodocyclaceae bacterium]|nr:permease-like cell division protein FtsX [Rhodocyclaceae bacterium]